MKTLINKCLIFFVASLALMSCEKDEERLVVKDGTVPTMSASANTVVLTEEEAANEALTINWTASEFGYPAAVNYTLQLDMKGNNFEAPVEADLGGGSLKKTFTVSELNTLINKLPITAFRENEIEARLKASVSDNVDPVYSNVTAIKATPYLTEPPYATLYMVGDATEFEWDNAKATPMYRSEEDIFIYTYTGRLKAGNLKFLGKLGSWTPMWGSDGNNNVVFRETESDPDPASFTIASEGYYTVSLDLRNNKYTIAPYNASGATVYPSIGIIGAFNDWGGIEPMTKSAFNPHAWTIEYTFDTDVQLKFRHAPNWDVNWGTEVGKEAAKYGKGKQGGENLQVSAGTYKILFNDLTGHYVFIKK